ncbi:VirB2 family type IV secretion system major pilin TrwL [Bartonella gliris]|uniref:VirB2 family type IV secretion system major pilin TrwL n=1 Tax=Bartonella gliris TaxID=3004109 RepID=UPI00295EC298|nr:VirB2 family type IV secretion system major pilin TrwL [Bartonella gliris]
MKKSNIFQLAINDRIIVTVTTVFAFFITHPVYAQTLNNAKGVLQKFQTELKGIIPIAAAIILLGLAIGYAGRYIEKDTFVRWAIGVVIAGSALEIANILFTTNG